LTLTGVAVLFLLGLTGGFVAGVVGLGGAIVMIPLLLYMPPLLGLPALDMKTVAGITMAQVMVGAIAGVSIHWRYRAVNARLVLFSGATMAGGTFTGAFVSRYVDAGLLLAVFAVLVAASAVIMLLPIPSIDPEVLTGDLRYDNRLAAALAAGVGIVAGMVGAGGAFLLLPLFLVVVRVPMRIAIGSSLAIAAVGAVFGFTGKLVTGQVPLALATPVALGALGGALGGARLSRRVSVPVLRAVLFVILLATAIRVWHDVLVR
jgi:uncharacterized membrane protein YfcA